VPVLKVAPQVVPQLIAAGDEVTVPVPLPPLAIASEKEAWTTWFNGADVDSLNSPSPGYSTVIECVPVESDDLVHCASPATSATALQRIDAPSLKLIVPLTSSFWEVVTNPVK